MNIQLALDRMAIEEAIGMAAAAEEYVDWLEVGTSLIKEFGMDSVRAMKKAFPNKVIVADMKTNDNAQYECRLCFEAGADIATVMGTSPLVTIEACIAEAEKRGKQMMIDLLHTTPAQQEMLSRYNAILCLHTSKDEQELGTKQNRETGLQAGLKRAVAGGITLESLPAYKKMNPLVFIIGSAITKAEDPARAAAAFKQQLNMEESK
ncbi:orotidine 5'-phosphate decarboxylase [Domibacillus indicus]|uniref:3-hexulose-6-phosphate synthase n=1 Tax=Domibacillus indicus TaxID=1437523 RepID=UPI0020423520|nr:3-hexulose-6-phosphate synthase [Domibacillus indicus]MCM3787289.1 orotidine 5'-phosphate decarboxylase [Domibacillus indicus]